MTQIHTHCAHPEENFLSSCRHNASSPCHFHRQFINSAPNMWKERALPANHIRSTRDRCSNSSCFHLFLLAHKMLKERKKNLCSNLAANNPVDPTSPLPPQVLAATSTCSTYRQWWNTDAPHRHCTRSVHEDAVYTSR